MYSQTLSMPAAAAVLDHVCRASQERDQVAHWTVVNAAVGGTLTHLACFVLDASASKRAPNKSRLKASEAIANASLAATSRQ